MTSYYGTAVPEPAGHGQLPQLPPLKDEDWCEGACVPKRECPMCQAEVAR